MKVDQFRYTYLFIAFQTRQSHPLLLLTLKQWNHLPVQSMNTYLMTYTFRFNRPPLAKQSIIAVFTEGWRSLRKRFSTQSFVRDRTFQSN